jgi:hypothetical protein
MRSRRPKKLPQVHSNSTKLGVSRFSLPHPILRSPKCSPANNHPFLTNRFLPEETLPGFAADALEFMHICHAVYLRIFRAIAVGLGTMPANYFDKYHTVGDDMLQLNHYIAGPADQAINGRLSAHTVSTLFTGYALVDLHFPKASTSTLTHCNFCPRTMPISLFFSKMRSAVCRFMTPPVITSSSLPLRCLVQRSVSLAPHITHSIAKSDRFSERGRSIVTVSVVTPES